MRLTAVKKTPERAWLSEVSSAILQQLLRDLDAAVESDDGVLISSRYFTVRSARMGLVARI
ncbi:hypothetical protein [Streptomyces sp. NPDC001292]|uniref:hypothetical protein n=1 Tax=Streptomyces sp. NPDC001292 TaxID=3364558 RepID=UPI0036B8FBF1